MISSAPAKLRYHTWWNAIGGGFVLLVVYLSLIHPPQSIGPKVFDVGHVIAYGWLMTWFAQIHRPISTRLGIGVALCLLGIALEFAQREIGYRTFDYADMAMNTLGVAIGLLLALTPVQNGLYSIEQRLTNY